MTGANCSGQRNGRSRRAGDDHVVIRIGNAIKPDAGDDLRVTGRVGDEIAVLIGAKEGHVPHVLIGQQNAKHQRLGLDLTPGGHAARKAAAAFDEFAGRDRMAVTIQLILTQKHLVRRVRAVGLVLIDIGGGRVDRPDIIGRSHDAIGPGGHRCARQHHEIGVAPLDIEGVIRLQRNEHGAAAALVDQIEAVIEELPEQREPRVERGRKATVGRDIRQMDIVAVHGEAERRQRGITHHARASSATTVASWATVAAASASSAACSAALGGVRGSPSSSALAADLALSITTRA